MEVGLSVIKIIIKRYCANLFELQNPCFYNKRVEQLNRMVPSTSEILSFQSLDPKEISYSFSVVHPLIETPVFCPSILGD